MKNFRLLFLTIITNLVLGACGNESESLAPKLSIDLDRQDSIKWEDMFANIEVVPLQFTSESMIIQIEKILIQDGHYFVLDRRANAIYKFNSDGNYNSKLDNMGSDLGQYHPIVDMTINPYSGDVEFISVDGIHYTYTKEFEFVDSFVFPDILNLSKFGIFSEDVILLFSTHHSNNENNLFLYSRSKRDHINTIRIKKHLFEEASVYTLATPLIETPEEFLFCTQYTNTVYGINPDGLELKYTWDFGKYYFDPGDLKEGDPQEKFLDQVRKNSNSGFSSLYNYAENKKLIFTQFGVNNRLGTLLYFKDSHEYKIFYDSNSGVASRALVLLDDGFVAYSRADDINNVLKYSNNNSNYDYLINNPHESNPVIFKYTFKD